VRTAGGANGPDRAVNPARLLLEVSAPISTLLNRVPTCLVASGPLRAANRPITTTTEVILRARLSTTPHPALILQAAIGQAAIANPTLTLEVTEAAINNTTRNLVPTCLVATGPEVIANLPLTATPPTHLTHHLVAAARKFTTLSPVVI